jgi:hypothetical protein
MRPTPPSAVGGLEISQFQQRMVPRMLGFFDSEMFQPISHNDALDVAFHLS